MGLAVKFNPDLASRDFSECKVGKRKTEECNPEKLEAGKAYPFLKRGRRNSRFGGELPLLETKGERRLSRLKASIRILETRHFVEDSEVWTKRRCEVVAVFTDENVYLESYARR